jgi:hypothetical protein
MDQLRNHGDERQLAACVYCRGEIETREHIPSRVFLDKPYPENLPVIPACRWCNGSFSKDEVYFACLVEYARAGSVDSVERDKIKRVLQERPALAAKMNQAQTWIKSNIHISAEVERVRRVVYKLAQGHAAFELNEPQYEPPSRINFVPLMSMSEEYLDYFESTPLGSIWPEVGSRAMQRLVVSDFGMKRSEWIVVQPSRYRYLANVDSAVTVRIVVAEYLGCEVVWR